jgi:hypothetical protein
MKRVLAMRMLVLTACGFWLGGLTFYAAVVIPTATRVLGSHVRVGFITQRVTNWINVSAVIALGVLLLALVLPVGSGRRRYRFLLVATWCLMAAAQIGLFVLHPLLDGALDPVHRQIVDEPRFYRLHRGYLWLAMSQQVAGVTHVCGLITAWHLRDREGPPAGE